jgi:hypothetical protein
MTNNATTHPRLLYDRQYKQHNVSTMLAVLASQLEEFVGLRPSQPRIPPHAAAAYNDKRLESCAARAAKPHNMHERSLHWRQCRTHKPNH